MIRQLMIAAAVLVAFASVDADAAKVRGLAYNPATHAALVNDPWTGNTWLGLKWTSGVSEVTGVAPGSNSGMSVAQVRAAMLPGGAFEGWRYATYTEATTLLTQGFGLPSAVDQVYFNPHPHLPAVNAFSNTMGFLFRPEMPGMFANGLPVYLAGATGVIGTTATTGLGFSAADTQWTGHPFDVFIDTIGYNVTAGSAASWTGHFLVLDQVTPPPPAVPAPAALGLLALGLGILRRRR